MYNSKELMHYACDVGEEKLKKSLLSVFISSILAGLFIGLGYMGFLYLSKYFHYGYVFSERYFASVTFGTGLVMIIIAGGELFTGNCLLTMGAYAKRYSFFKVMGNLGLVWIGNFVGAIFLVFLVCFSVNYEEIIPQITTLSEVKNNMVFLEAFFKGILCNILVSMAVYISYASKTIPGKILAAILPVSLFVICGFEHSVANMFIIPLGYFSGADITLKGMFLNNLLPVTLGNFIGGGIIISGAYYLIYRKK